MTMYADGNSKIGQVKVYRCPHCQDGVITTELRAKLDKYKTAIGDTQDFLKYLIAGKSQYYHGDRLMANGMHHALQLREELLRVVKET